MKNIFKAIALVSIIPLAACGQETENPPNNNEFVAAEDFKGIKGEAYYATNGGMVVYEWNGTITKISKLDALGINEQRDKYKFLVSNGYKGQPERTKKHRVICEVVSMGHYYAINSKSKVLLNTWNQRDKDNNCSK